MKKQDLMRAIEIHKELEDFENKYEEIKMVEMMIFAGWLLVLAGVGFIGNHIPEKFWDKIEKMLKL